LAEFAAADLVELLRGPLAVAESVELAAELAEPIAAAARSVSLVVATS
jgi:hypothetical protein